MWKLIDFVVDVVFEYFRYRAQQRYRPIVGDNRSISRFVDWRDKLSTPLIWKVVLLKGGSEQVEDGWHKT